MKKYKSHFSKEKRTTSCSVVKGALYNREERKLTTTVADSFSRFAVREDRDREPMVQVIACY